MEEALKTLGATLLKLGAPLLGTAIAGPAGGVIAGTVIGALADALGTSPTPEAVGKALETKPEAKIIAKQVEAEQAPAVMEEVNAYLRDMQDARATTVKLVEQGSVIAWGAPIVSFMVMLAFGVFSYLAISSPVSGPAREVVMYLLGAWQGLAATVIAYWVGSSAGSASKEAALTNLARRR